LALLGLRLNVHVAVRLDAEMLLASVGPDLSELGRECLALGLIRDLKIEDGGASAVIAGPDCGSLGVWVGVVDGVLTGECDCVDNVSGSLCGHAVAIALKALEKGFAFSSISARARGVDPEEQLFAEIATGLTPGVLIGLVVRQATSDRYFAALLLSRAGRLPPAGPAEIDAARRVIAEAANVPNEPQWDPYDVVKASKAMVAELDLLGVRPPTDEQLVVTEEAMAAWIVLSDHLNDFWEIYETEQEEIGSALAELHLRLCQAHDPEPHELAKRLAKLVWNADGQTFLDIPERYANVLGAEGVAEFDSMYDALLESDSL